MGLLWLQAEGRKRIQLLHGRVGDLGQLAAAHDQRVGGQHAGAAGVGDDGQVGAVGARLLGEHLGHVEDVGDAVDAQHADAAEGGIEHVVAAGQRAGVRGGGLGGGARCARP